MAEIKLPKITDAGPKLSVGRWFKREGVAVTVHEARVEIDTDNVTHEIRTPVQNGALEPYYSDGFFAVDKAEAIRKATEWRVTAASLTPDAVGSETPSLTEKWLRLSDFSRNSLSKLTEKIYRDAEFPADLEHPVAARPAQASISTNVLHPMKPRGSLATIFLHRVNTGVDERDALMSDCFTP
jgi:hypothetical protein